MLLVFLTSVTPDGMEYKMVVQALSLWLMRIMDHMTQRGLSVDRYLFMATDKMFGFGGDTSRRADCSVRLPVYIGGNCGYMECFVIEDATPLLVGRPILQALKINMNYQDNQMTVAGGPWIDVPTGEKGEYVSTST